ncbi:hypothetical protein HK101_006134 [Irineochytrium annulatum]|nr:hypothetical protein HK101_006134 [Irineochytrium annulatum]
MDFGAVGSSSGAAPNGFSHLLKLNGIDAFFEPVAGFPFIQGYNGLSDKVVLKGQLVLQCTKDKEETCEIDHVEVLLTIGLGGTHYKEANKKPESVREFFESTPPDWKRHDLGKVLHSAKEEYKLNTKIMAASPLLLPFSFPIPATLPPSYDSYGLHWSLATCAYRLEALIFYRGQPETIAIDVPAPFYSQDTIRAVLANDPRPVHSRPVVDPGVKQHDVDWSVSLDSGVKCFGETFTVAVDINPRKAGDSIKTSEVLVQLFEHYDLPAGTAGGEGLANSVAIVSATAAVSTKTSGKVTVQLPVPRQAPGRDVMEKVVNPDGSWDGVIIRHSVKVTLKRSKMLMMGVDARDVLEVPVAIAAFTVQGARDAAASYMIALEE